MGFVKKSANKTPIVDTVFAIVAKAKEAKAKYGSENVVDATIGSLYNEEGKIVAFDSVFNTFDAIPNANKAAYAASFTGNPDYRALCKEWTLGKAHLDLPCSVIATPGGTGAVSLTMSEFLEVGETVVIPDIAWGSYALMAQDKQLNVARYEMFDGDSLNLSSIKEQINALVGKQNRIVLVVNDPCHNPTGYSMTHSEWEELIEFLNEVGKTTPCILLNDIAYIDYAYDVEKSREYMKVFEKLSDQVMVVIAMSCSKTLTSYGMRCGAAIICANKQEDVREAEIVFEKSARALWSNINNGAMINFVNIIKNHEEEFESEKAKYIDLIKTRSEIFIQEANDCDLPYYPYKEGFFVTLKVDNAIKQKYHDVLMENNIFTVQVNKGIRVAVCSLPVEKAKGLSASLAKKSEYGECSKYVTFRSTSKGKETDDKVKAVINEKVIDEDLRLAGYNLLVTSEIKAKATDIYSTYHNLWRIEESFRIMKSDLDARPVFLQKEDTIKGHFLICYLTVLLIRLFQFCELDNTYSSSEVLRFMKDLKVVGNGKGFINITIGNSFISELAKKTELPLDHYTLSERQLKKVLNFKI